MPPRVWGGVPGGGRGEDEGAKSGTSHPFDDGQYAGLPPLPTQIFHWSVASGRHRFPARSPRLLHRADRTTRFSPGSRSVGSSFAESWQPLLTILVKATLFRTVYIAICIATTFKKGAL